VATLRKSAWFILAPFRRDSRRKRFVRSPALRRNGRPPFAGAPVRLSRSYEESNSLLGSQIVTRFCTMPENRTVETGIRPGFGRPDPVLLRPQLDAPPKDPGRL